MPFRDCPLQNFTWLCWRLLDARSLPAQFALNRGDVDIRKACIGLDGKGRGDASTLPCNGAAHHIADGCMADLVAPNGTACNEEIFDALGQH